MGLLAAAGLAPVTVAEQAVAALAPTRLSRSMFTTRVGTTFRFVAGGRTHYATLQPVRDLANSTPGHAYRFSLVFRARTIGPPQGTYTFYHPTLGRLSLFVVPVGTGRRNYEAVIYS
jgi:xanthine/CO dehydrogenase XdhC/CoxF family maturation factor